MPNFIYRPRAYVHFDLPLRREAAQTLVTDAEAVAKHSFYPFIFSVQVTHRIARDEEGKASKKPPKERIIAYAAHRDSHILGHYSDILGEHYEALLHQGGLQECVTAFRKLNGRRNIHFANDVFEFIREADSCAALAMDASDFFGSLDHAQLKIAWGSMIQQDRLPADHHAVFRAITKYTQVNLETLLDVLHIPPHKPRSDGNHRLPHLDNNGRHTIPDNPQRLCSPDRFRQWVREKGLLQINDTGKGIPQGSPISAILSNIYMLKMDSALNTFTSSNGGLYRRYCDDILIVMPTVELRDQARQMIETWLSQLKLHFNPTKTETVDFPAERPITGKPLQYLGFTFDGLHKRIRPASVARFYRKMPRGVLRAKIQRAKADKQAGRKDPSPLKKKKLYRLYSYLGTKLGRNKDEKRNFLSYAFDAARIMNDTGIKKQVKRHWKKLQEEIDEPLPPPPPPFQIREAIRNARDNARRIQRATGATV